MSFLNVSFEIFIYERKSNQCSFKIVLIKMIFFLIILYLCDLLLSFSKQYDIYMIAMVKLRVCWWNNLLQKMCTLLLFNCSVYKKKADKNSTNIPSLQKSECNKFIWRSYPFWIHRSNMIVVNLYNTRSLHVRLKPKFGLKFTILETKSNFWTNHFRILWKLADEEFKA